MAIEDRPEFKTKNIYDVLHAVGGDRPVYHDPYQWSAGPRKADRALDIPGPHVSEHADD